MVLHSASLLSPADAAGVCVDGQANTGLAFQTSHLCVCMGTASPQSTGVSRLSDRPFTHTLVCAGPSRSDPG